LVTTISINPKMRIREKRLKDCTITFSPKLDNVLFSEREKKFNEAKQQKLISGEDSKDYAFVKVFINASSELEALYKGMDNLNFIRGLWNFSINQNWISSVHHFQPNPMPINTITLGQIHTLHDSETRLSKRAFMYEDNYRFPLEVLGSISILNQLYEREKSVRKELNRHNKEYREEIVKLIIRYVDALDNYQFNIVFALLWGILESLTNTTNEKQELLTKRTKFHYKGNKKQYVGEQLKILTEYRNRKVHVGKHIHFAETLCYYTKLFVDKLLKYHIDNKYHHKNIEEASRFLDLSQDKNILLDEIKTYEEKIAERQKSIHYLF